MTWWRRVGATILALGIFTLGFMGGSAWSTPNQLGREIFEILSGFGLVCALLTGPLATTDCIGRERRDGTLGLLFLTPLHSYDVVLGKVVVASFDMVLVAMAALPVMALPFLMGGVSLTQFFYFALALLNLIVLSLSIGVFCSAFLSSGRASLAATVLIIFALTLGLPLLGEQVLHIRISNKTAPFFYSVCPLYTMDQVIHQTYRGGATWRFWCNIAGTHLFSWFLLLLACARTRSIWRDPPQTILQHWWREKWHRWTQGGRTARLAWRRSMLDKNPFSWLEGRDRLQERALWTLLVLSTFYWVCLWQMHPRSWPDNDAVILWPLFAHYILFFWIAVQAPRRLADDKQSGALELILATPLATRDILRGSMRILWRRFGRVAVTLLFISMGMVYIYFSRRWPRNLWQDEIFQLGIAGLFILPIQGYSFARVGLYWGLARGNSLQATFLLIACLGILPWLLFCLFVLGCEFSRAWLRTPIRLSNMVAFGVFATIHVLICGGFLLYANWQLHRNFRSLAAQMAWVPWWKRWFRFGSKEELTAPRRG